MTAVGLLVRLFWRGGWVGHAGGTAPPGWCAVVVSTRVLLLGQRLAWLVAVTAPVVLTLHPARARCLLLPAIPAGFPVEPLPPSPPPLLPARLLTIVVPRYSVTWGLTGIRAASVLDSREDKLVGVITVSDFMKVFCHLYETDPDGEPNVALSHMTIAQWKGTGWGGGAVTVLRRGE